CPPQPPGEATVSLERFPETLAKHGLQIDHLRAQGLEGAVGDRLIHGPPRKNGQIPSQTLQLKDLGEDEGLRETREAFQDISDPHGAALLRSAEPASRSDSSRRTSLAVAASSDKCSSAIRRPARPRHRRRSTSSVSR